MRYRLSTLLFNKCRSNLIQESKRYAGHNKWQNIKHTKESRDNAKSILFQRLGERMKAAISKTGDKDPASNPQLANLIDEARKVNMPAATIKTILNRLQNTIEDGRMHVVPVRSNTGVVLMLHILTANFNAVKQTICTILKKNNLKMDPSAITMFDCASYITTSKDCNLDQAMETVVEVDADDVEEVKYDDNTYFVFKTEFLFPDKVLTQLKNLSYEIISVEDRCIPTAQIEASETELEKIEKVKKALSEIQEVKKIEDNIAY